MKKLVTLFATALMMLFALSCQRYETFEGDPLGTKLYTLDNGLKVYMSVNKEEPRIQTYIAVKVGSKNDPAETTGLAHYFEHLMFKGSEKFGTSDYAAEKPMLDRIEELFEIYRATDDPAKREAIYHEIDSISFEASKLAIPNEYDKLMASIGADGTNAWTSTDETVYTEDIPSNQIENWAKIQADRFRHNVIRGFHTELETIYEEKNMSLTQDNRKVWEALDKALFPHHPYGKQTTIGSQEHLKNPSITNVKKYYSTYYVPNNIAICLSGDFDPDEMVAVIEKYFGDWEPNKNIPVLEYEPEEDVTSPIEMEVYGLEAENIALAWRLPGSSDLKTMAVAQIASSIFYNGQAGLCDLDINQQQKALSINGGLSASPDYSQFVVMGRPKQGQSLDELRNLALDEIAKLRSGDFDESLINATINNIKLEKMRALESNSSRAVQYVDAFIAGVDWADACKELELLEAVTKEDVVAFANKYLAQNAYAVVYKKVGEDKNIQKISAPKITPIVTNRDMVSDFVKEVQASEVKPIEPVFVDFSKELSFSDLAKGVNVIYKHNDLNDIFNLTIQYNTGSIDTPELGVAADYISYLGTPERSSSEIASRMYELGCQFSVSVGSTKSAIRISGLSENMSEAISIVEDLVLNAQPDEQILANLKADIFKSRANAKTNQRSCSTALLNYAIYGPDYISKANQPNENIAALTSDQLLSKIREVYMLGHEILYYGPMSEAEANAAIKESHNFSAEAEALPEIIPPTRKVEKSNVLLSQYDSRQLYYYQYSDRGEKFDAASAAVSNLYNEYFGGGMNTIVFQEMREARGLAYSAWARLYSPNAIESDYYYVAFIATQNDKMRQAIEAFDSIINDMPQSEAAFKIAKDALISRLRTQRTNGAQVISQYLSCRRLGLEEPLDRRVFEQVQNMTLEDVVAYQQEMVKGRNYTYTILGDLKDIDINYLSSLGEIKVLSQKDIFGF